MWSLARVIDCEDRGAVARAGRRSGSQPGGKRSGHDLEASGKEGHSRTSISSSSSCSIPVAETVARDGGEAAIDGRAEVRRKTFAERPVTGDLNKTLLVEELEYV